MTTSVKSDWSVHVIEFARSKDQPLASLVHGAHADGVVDLPFSFILARDDDKTVLVDTGFMREGGGEVMSVKFGIPHWISPLRMLAAMDVTPETGDGHRDQPCSF